jgi:Trypsin-like peptidase domain
MRRVIPALAFLLAAAGVALADTPPPDLGARVIRSLVKVAAVCGDQKSLRVASGFVWGEQHQIVTNLHVIVGCTMPVSVLYFVPDPNGGGMSQTVRAATVASVLRAADLVLLTVDKPPDAPSLQVATQSPVPEDEVQAFGFPLGIQAPVNTRLQVTFANDLFPQLSSTLDDAAREQLTKLQFPDLKSEVLHLSGPLQPGDSGAPVVNTAGEVVGIGSGGLQQGAASISWAMRARYLTELASSKDTTLPAAGHSGTLFAVMVQAQTTAKTEPPPGVQCGAFKLAFRGTRPLAELIETGGAALPTNTLAKLGEDPAVAASSFDIWIEPNSGAAAVVPQGASLVPDKSFCRVEVGPHVRLLVRLERLPDHPATPEWALSVAQRRFQALIRYSNEIKDGVGPAPNLIDWDTETVTNGALLFRGVRKARNGDARIYRADLDGRGVSLAEAAVIDIAEDQAPTETRLALARALNAVALATFAPPDRSQAGEKPSVVPDDGEGGPGRPIYPWTRCGVQFQLMSSVPTFAELLARRKDAATVATSVQQIADLSVDSIDQAQYDVWAQTPSGIATLVLRGFQVVPAKVAGDACLFKSLTDPNLAAAVIGIESKSMPDVAVLQDAITRALGAKIGDLQAMRDVVPNVTLWQATGTRNGHNVRIVMSLQRRGEWNVVYGISAADIAGLNRRLASSYGGVLLAPSVTDSLNR